MTDRATLIKLADLTEEPINPATEDKQDDIIAAISGAGSNYTIRHAVNSGDSDITYVGLAAIASAEASAV